MTNSSVIDARGVEIEPGDTVIYGFGVGRSIAMAEGVVLGKEVKEKPPHFMHLMNITPCCGSGSCCCDCNSSPSVSLTASGRVRIRVVRRSYSSGEKPVVDVMPDRLVVLKRMEAYDLGWGVGDSVAVLPPSPLPTQDEVAWAAITDKIERYTEGLCATEVPEWWRDRGRTPEEDLAAYHAFCAKELAENRRKLRALDDE